MATKTTTQLIEDTFDQIAQFGDGKLEFETRDIERLAKFAKKYVDLQEKIMLHQAEDGSDLCTIGELVLSEMNLWM